ncbi:MAG TPA: Rrf2 family transcriptional regulator [Alphaproteobacteria bacterium]
MSANSRLTIAIHILTWMALVGRKRPDPVTSNRIALSVNTNPVVIRRILGRLSKKGLVRSHRGANAGWVLAKPPRAITLRDVYDALGEGPSFALHAATPNQACPVGRGIRPALTRVYDSLDGVLRTHLARTTIEDVLADTLRRPNLKRT